MRPMLVQRREKIREHINRVQDSQRLAALAAAKIPLQKRETIAADNRKGSKGVSTGKAASPQGVLPPRN